MSEVVAVGLKPRPEWRARRLAGYRRTLPKCTTALPDRLKPPNWRAWQARNGGKGWYWRAPRAVEWGLEWFVYHLRSLALFELLELAGRTTILVAVIFWFLDADGRTKERHYRAWDLINSARGSPGDGGRRDALQDLNKDGVSLAAAPLEQAWLPGVDLGLAYLESANLQGAFLRNANLKKSLLMQANLQGADLLGANLASAGLDLANLASATLVGATLAGANLGRANLQNAKIWSANLEGANLTGARLKDAELVMANLQGADLQGANLAGANLGFAKLVAAKLYGVDLRGVNYLTQEQLDAADGDDRTQLPDGLTRPTHWTEPEAPPAPQPDAAGRAPAPDGASGSDK